jgi:integrase/recombinase XerD
MAPIKVLETRERSPLAELADDWLAEVKIERSPRTVASYEWPVRRLLIPFAEREGVTTLAKIDQKMLNRLSQELTDNPTNGKPLSPSSKASYLRQINVFLRWGAQSEGRDKAVVAKFKRPDKVIIDTLDRKTIQQLEDAAQGQERDALILRILADTGIRLGELLGLKTTDLITTDKGAVLRVMGKGSKQREVPVMRPLAKRLRLYIDRQRPKDARSDSLLVTLRRGRKTGQYDPLTKRSVEVLVKVLAERAGVDPKRVHPHALRHSLATHMLREGSNPIKVAELLGHKGLGVLYANYSHVIAADARDDLERLLVD